MIQSESSIDGHIDLILVLKAVPDDISLNTLKKVELFNFKIFQESLIAHQNREIVEAFEYFDQRNKDRVYSIKNRLLDQKRELLHVQDILKSVDRKLSRDERRKSIAHNKNISASEERKKVKKKIKFEEEPRTEARRSHARDNIKNKDNESSNSSKRESFTLYFKYWVSALSTLTDFCDSE